MVVAAAAPSESSASPAPRRPRRRGRRNVAEARDGPRTTPPGRPVQHDSSGVPVADCRGGLPPLRPREGYVPAGRLAEISAGRMRCGASRCSARAGVSPPAEPGLAVKPGPQRVPVALPARRQRRRKNTLPQRNPGVEPGEARSGADPSASESSGPPSPRNLKAARAPRPPKRPIRRRAGLRRWQAGEPRVRG